MAFSSLKWLVTVAFIAIALGIVFIPREFASYENLTPIEVREPLPPPPKPKPLMPVPTHLKPVCACESLGDPNAEPRQFNPDGTVIQGPGNNWGICQINATAHDAEAKALGIDYMTREGNIAFANILYAGRGYKPWYPWSGHCWENDPRIDQVKLQEAKEALSLNL